MSPLTWWRKVDLETLRRKRDLAGALKATVRAWDTDHPTAWMKPHLVLLEIVPELSDQAVAPLVNAMKRGGKGAEFAVDALGMTHSRRAVAPLQAALNDPRLQDRARASLANLELSFTQDASASQEAEERRPVVEQPPLASLPAVDPDVLPTGFAARDEAGGSGAAEFEDGIRAWNRRDFDGAAALFEESLKAGLVSTWAASAEGILGEIHLRRGNLEEGVDHLMRALATRPITSERAHECAVRLEIIYEASGRHEESAALAQIAAATVTPGVVLAGSYAEELRALVRSRRASTA